MSLTKADRVLVIQVSTVGRLAFRSMIARSLEQDVDYRFFSIFDPDILLTHVVPGFRQLILTSHVDEVKAPEVAETVKSINPDAFIFALTSSLCSAEGTELDGVIPKMTMPHGFMDRFIRCFEAGCSRNDLIRVIKEIRD
ncbi:hypothetical protein KGP36_07080 [Patescibacteria group bacterium]|nr:hypothetical protein [Patescibacteria group bacterium]